MMPDREMVIKGLECCAGQCNYHGCPYKDPCENANGIKQIMLDALALLKEQDDYYKNLVVEWLREIALNNYTDETEMRFVDAVEEIKDRAEYGLKNYFSDSRRSAQ